MNSSLSNTELSKCLFLKLRGALLLGIATTALAQNPAQDYKNVTAITSSQNTAQSPLTLQAAVERALSSYPTVQMALQKVLVANANIALVRTQNLPQANMLWQTSRSTYNNIAGLMMPQGVVPSLSGTVLNTTSNQSVWNAAGGLLVGWEPSRFGYRRAEEEAARSGRDASNSALTLTRLDVAAATATAYLSVTAAQQQVLSAQADLNRRKTFSSSIHTLVDNQLRPGADASEADAEVAAAQTRLIQAQTAAKVAMAGLAQLLSLPSSQLELNGDAVLHPPSTQPETEFSAVRHPLALQQQSLLEQLQSQEEVLSRSYLPRFTLEGLVAGRGSGVSPSGKFNGGTDGLAPTRENWAVGIQATFSPFDYFSIREQKKIAAANEKSQELNVKNTTAAISTQVEQARAQYEGAVQIAQNTPVQLSAARMAESQARARYQAGLANIVEVTQAEALLQQSEVQDALARIETWRALLNLNAAKGDLTPFLTEVSNSTGGH